MSDPFTVLIPGSPPSLNAAYRVVKIGGSMRLAKQEKVEAWQTEVSYRVRQARPSGWLPGRRVKLTVDFWMPRAGRDADNPSKFLQDGVAVGLGINDSICLLCIRSNEVDRVSPRTLIEISNEG